MTTMQRQLCWVTPQLALSGALPEEPEAKSQELDAWVAAGVTHIVDARVERSEEAYVASHPPSVGYSWIGFDGPGGSRPYEWFDIGAGSSRTRAGWQRIDA